MTTTTQNDRVVRIWGTGDTGLSGSGKTQTATLTVTEVDDASQTTPGAVGAAYVQSHSPENWGGQTVALKPGFQPFTLNVPGDYAPNTGDFLIATIAVQSSNVGGICAPTGWNKIAVTPSGTERARSSR